jgi:hypothetical protein
MNQTPASKKREIIAALAVLIVIVAIVTAASMSAKQNPADAAVATTTTTTTTPASSTAPSTAYKNGSYTAVGSYDSPGGSEGITVDVTLQNGIITATSATSGANDVEAGEYQSMFISGYKKLVVGKNIASVKVSRVSGSSLTSQGFNSAIQKIAAAAKA